MTFWLAMAFLLGVPALFVVIPLRRNKKHTVRFRRAFAKHPDVVVAALPFNRFELRTRHDRLPATLQLTREFVGDPDGKHEHQPTWTVTVEGMTTSTTLYLKKQSVHGTRDSTADVQVGEPVFDQRFVVTGSDPAVITALLQRPEARAAVTTLFSSDIRQCDLFNGRLIVRADRPDDSTDVARLLLDRVRQLAAVLDRR